MRAACAPVILQPPGWSMIHANGGAGRRTPVPPRAAWLWVVSSPSPKQVRASVPGGNSREARTAQNPVRERAAQLSRVGMGF